MARRPLHIIAAIMALTVGFTASNATAAEWVDPGVAEPDLYANDLPPPRVRAPNDAENEAISDLKVLISRAEFEGSWDDVVELNQMRLEIEVATFGPEHPVVAASYSRIARAYVASGDLARAKGLYDRALAIDRATLGDAHRETGKIRRNLAKIALAGSARPH